MKIKDTAANFKKFLTFCALPGTDVEGQKTFFKKVRGKIGKTGGTFFVTNESHDGFVSVSYKPAKVETVGEFWTDDLSHLLTLLSAISKGDIVVDVDEEKIKIFGSPSRISTDNCDKKEIKESEFAETVGSSIKRNGTTNATIHNTVLPYYVKTKAELMQQVVKNASLVKGNVFYPFVVAKDGTLTIDAADDYDKIQTEIGKIAEFESEPFENTYLTGFDNVFSNLSGDIELFFGENTPLIVYAKDGEYELMAMIVPWKPKEIDPDAPTEEATQ